MVAQPVSGRVRILTRACLWGRTHSLLGSPGGTVVKNPSANAGDVSSIPGSGRSPGGGNGNPLQYSHPKNPKSRGAWCATVHGVTKSRTQLNDWAHTHTDSTPLHQGYDNASFIKSQLLNLEHKNQIVLSAWAKATKIGNQITLGLLGKKKL